MRTFCGVVIPQKRTDTICEMALEHPRTNYRDNTPQKKTKLVHKTHTDEDDAKYTRNDSPPINGNVSKMISVSSHNSSSGTGTIRDTDVDIDHDEGVEINHEQTNLSKADSAEEDSSSSPPPSPYPRLDRKRGRHNNAAGPSYAIRDPAIK